MNHLSDKICDKMPRISVVVVGDSESGKTQLINRFSGEKFSNVRYFIFFNTSLPFDWK